MLAFSFMASGNQPFMPGVDVADEAKYKYKNMKEFRKSVIDVNKKIKKIYFKRL